jgi:tRNA dimethylallyltransferase
MPPLIAIVGETASGKSDVAMELARKFNGEIICADSWTVYRGFDIGTAKPTLHDRAQVAHHLLDVADPAVGFSVAVFQRLARQAIADISRRNKLPIMVGGAGLYVDSILYDYSFLPPPSVGLREELNMMTIKELIMRMKSLSIDATGIDLRNKRRVIRLIENNGARPQKHSIREHTLILGLAVPRDMLRMRIALRVDTMLRRGLEAEARTLADLYGWEAEPMKGIGYREWREYFNDMQTLTDTRERIIKASMDLAKKQRTWFGRNPSIHWLSDRSYIEEILTTFLNKIY